MMEFCMRRPFREFLRLSISRFVSCTLVVCLTFLMSGCGGSDLPQGIAISGTVTFGGKPLTGGEVVYTPSEKGDARMARGLIEEDGTFRMVTSGSVSGVLPGKYLISIVPSANTGASSGPASDPIGRPSESREVKITFPERYLNAEKSGLEDNVDENHSGNKVIELTD